MNQQIETAIEKWKDTKFVPEEVISILFLIKNKKNTEAIVQSLKCVFNDLVISKTSIEIFDDLRKKLNSLDVPNTYCTDSKGRINEYTIGESIKWEKSYKYNDCDISVKNAYKVFADMVVADLRKYNIITSTSEINQKYLMKFLMRN